MALRVLPQVGVGGPARGPIESQNFATYQPGQGPENMVNLGRAVEGVGLEISNIASMIKSENDTARSKEGFNEWMANNVETLENPKTGYLTTTTGRAAAGYARAQALGSIEKRAHEIEQGMENDVQRGQFRSAVDKTFVGIKERVYGHEAKHLRVYNIGQTDIMANQSADAAAEAIIAGEVDPRIVAGAEVAAQEQQAGTQEPQSLRGKTYAEAQRIAAQSKGEQANNAAVMRNTVVDQARELADLHQLPADAPERALIMQEKLTRMHARVVSSLVRDGFGARAKTYLDGVNGNELTADAKDQLGRLVKGATDNDRAMATANDLVDELIGQGAPVDPANSEAAVAAQGNRRSPVDVNSSQFLLSAYTELRRRFELPTNDPKHLSADDVAKTFSQIQQQHALQVDAFNDNAKKAIDDTMSWMGDPANAGMTPNSPSFPAELTERLRDSGKLDEARALNPGAYRTTDYPTWMEFVQSSEAGELQGMSESELTRRWFLRVDPTSWGRIHSHWASSNGLNQDGSKRAPGARTSFTSKIMSNKEQLWAIAARTGVIASPLGPKPKSDEEAKSILWQSELFDIIEHEEAVQPDTPVTWARVREIAGELRDDTVLVDGGFWDTSNEWFGSPSEEVPAYTLKDAALAEASIVTPSGRYIKIPAGAEKEEIIDMLKMQQIEDPIRRRETKAAYDAATSDQDRQRVLIAAGVGLHRPSAKEIGIEVEKDRATAGYYGRALLGPQPGAPDLNQSDVDDVIQELQSRTLDQFDFSPLAPLAPPEKPIHPSLQKALDQLEPEQESIFIRILQAIGVQQAAPVRKMEPRFQTPTRR
jgi:hypothetical protein